MRIIKNQRPPTGIRKPERTYFFVQARTREAWHVESFDNCEIMLCGYRIPVDAEQSRVQFRWGPRKCPDCWIILEGDKAMTDE